MPRLKVPLVRPRPTPTVSLSYRVLGTGPVLVLLIPGLCVPADMYDSMAAVLRSTDQFSAVVLDNRGMGRSEAPYARAWRAPGYTVQELAADAWDVVDAVLAARKAGAGTHTDSEDDEDKSNDGDDGDAHRGAASGAREEASPFRQEIAVVGHSMGGMIAQHMLYMRPRQVRFVALLSTHSGGIWNLIPTTTMLRGVAKVAWSGFDRDVNAAVNLSLHFTQRFLDDVVDGLSDAADERHSEGASVREGLDIDGDHVVADSASDDLTEDVRIPPASPQMNSRDPDDLGNDGCPGSESDTSAATRPERTTSPRMVQEGVLTVDHSADPQKQPQLRSDTDADADTSVAEQPTAPPSSLCDDAADPRSNKKPDTQPVPAPLVRARSSSGIGFLEHKLFEFARDARLHFGLTTAHFTNTLRKPKRAFLQAIAKRRRQRARRFEIYHAQYTGRELASETVQESRSLTNPEDSPNAIYGHACVVWSHALPRSFARRVRECTRIVKLVVLGRHDSVVTPSATRRLAHAVGANTVVEVEAAHFVTEEAAAEVTTQVIYGLRKAFFTSTALPCQCEWCAEDSQEEVKKGYQCQMC